MSWYQRWRNVFRPERLNNDLDREFEYHLAETVDRLVDEGMPEHAARREARRRLGNYSLQKERTRDMNVAAWLNATRSDLLYGVRQLRLNPGFAAVAILSLALGIGANTAIFELVNALRIKMLPVRDPAELVSIDFEKGATRAGYWPVRNATMSYPEWEQIRDQQQAFSGLAAWSADRFDLTKGGEPRYAESLYVNGDFFRTLGVGAVLGRTLTAQDDGPHCTAGAVLSHAFWEREFGSDPGALGRTLSLNGYSVPVIGVTPASFFGVEVGNRFDVAIPFCADRLLAEDKQGRMAVRFAFWVNSIGRLKPGWTVQSATAHLRALSPGIMRATIPPGYNPDLAKKYVANQLLAVRAATGVSQLRLQYERALWLLMATTGLVLLIACANLANLLLARAAVREQEIAVRLAIGASRGRLVRQLLAESLLLAFAGAACGVGLAMALSQTLVAFMSTPQNPVFIAVTLDLRVLSFTVALAVLTCLLFGLLPAVRATYLSPASTMRAGGRGITSGRERFSLRRLLVALQVAFSMVLLFGALLFARSLHNLLTVDTGFQPQGILDVRVDLSRAPYPEARRVAVYRELSQRLSALPGAISVAQVSFTPVSGGTWDNLASVDGAPAAQSGKACFFNEAGPGYFRTMQTRLIAGREFNDHDTRSAPRVAIVNEMFARTFFGGADPVGRTFHQAADAGQPDPVFQIVGLVANSKYSELREDFKPIAFFALGQDEHVSSGRSFVVRVAGAPGLFIDRAKADVQQMSSAIGIEFRPFSAELQASLLRERLMATLAEGFGFLAALVATLGLYGVISYMVARRRNEFGMRIALGAERADVIRLVLREAVVLLGVGLATGWALAWWAGQSAGALLFGLEPHDRVSLLAACVLLSITTLIASYVPARRAAALDPLTALRTE